jgi:hypothetical protein
MVCVMCMWRCGGWFVAVATSSASWFAILLLKIPVCALTFCIVILCLVHRI